MAGGVRRAGAHRQPARARVPGHGRHRVHRRAGPLVDAPGPPGQAQPDRRLSCCDRHGRGRDLPARSGRGGRALPSLLRRPATGDERQRAGGLAGGGDRVGRLTGAGIGCAGTRPGPSGRTGRSGDRCGARPAGDVPRRRSRHGGGQGAVHHPGRHGQPRRAGGPRVGHPGGGRGSGGRGRRRCRRDASRTTRSRHAGHGRRRRRTAAHRTLGGPGSGSPRGHDGPGVGRRVGSRRTGSLDDGIDGRIRGR